VSETLGDDPFSGMVFVFRSKRADRVKILVWDGSGLGLFWKRLEQRAFRWPPVTDGVMRLDVKMLRKLGNRHLALDGGASATLALKAGVWFRRARLVIVSPDSLGTAYPLSGRNST
jgi:hypothetical protein